MKNENIGCINPHGYYPFPASREVCPECKAIRARAATPKRGFNWVLLTACILCFLFWFAVGKFIVDWLAR